MVRPLREPSETPLLAWGETRRAAHARRCRLAQCIAFTGAGVMALLGTAVLPPLPRLVWNASASVPVGLYAISYRSAIRRGSVVLARPPAAARRFAALRGYLPLNVPLLKRVAAVGGDVICAAGPRILRNGELLVVRRAADARGRALPWWEGCVRLAAGQLFLINRDPASFDGRYFGVSAPRDVVGKAHKL